MNLRSPARGRWWSRTGLMDDLLKVAQQLENLNPGTPGPGGARQSVNRGRQGPPAPQVGTAADGRPRGVSSIRIEALLSKTLSKLDTHIVLVLTRPLAPGGTEKLELALLNHLRKSLERHSGEVPKDVSVCESLHDVIDQAERAFDNLASTPRDRSLALTAFLRERCSVARALGVASPQCINTLKESRTTLEGLADDADVPSMLTEKLSEMRGLLDAALNEVSEPSNLLEAILRK